MFQITIPSEATHLCDGGSLHWSFIKYVDGKTYHNMLDSRGWFLTNIEGDNEVIISLPPELPEQLIRHYDEKADTFQGHDIPQDALFVLYNEKCRPDFYTIINGQIHFHSLAVIGGTRWHKPINLRDFKNAIRLPKGVSSL